jgi:hypothetical protein
MQDASSEMALLTSSGSEPLQGAWAWRSCAVPELRCAALASPPLMAEPPGRPARQRSRREQGPAPRDSSLEQHALSPWRSPATRGLSRVSELSRRGADKRRAVSLLVAPCIAGFCATAGSWNWYRLRSGTDACAQGKEKARLSGPDPRVL